MNNVIYFQSGGPTSVINTSLYGAIKAFQESDKIEKFYGSKYGIEGILNEDLIEIDSKEDYSSLLKIPSAVLGSSRKKIDFNDQHLMNKIIEVLKKYSIKYILVNGGNDSMDTANKLKKYFTSINFPCHVIGVCKTVDNDLEEMDFTPGFASAVNYIVKTVMEINLDTRVYKKGRVTIIETMGRDAGWLCLSSSIANDYNLGPDLIYLPERPFSVEQFIEDVKKVYEKKQRVLVCVSEALKDENGNYLFCDKNNVDAFGHFLLGSNSRKLCDLVELKLGYKTRNIELNLMQRCSSLLINKLDSEVAYNCGYHAIKFALDNLDGVVCVKFNDQITYTLTSFDKVANLVKHVPLSFINEEGNGVSQVGKDYLKIFKDDSLKFEIPTIFRWE